jgi:hypothetical protein
MNNDTTEQNGSKKRDEENRELQRTVILQRIRPLYVFLFP